MSDPSAGQGPKAKKGFVRKDDPKPTADREADGRPARVLREEDPPGAGRALLQVPLRRGEEAQGRPACSTPATASARAATPARPSSPATRSRACSSRPSGTTTTTCRCRRRQKLPDDVIADFEKWVAMRRRRPARRQDGVAAKRDRHREGPAVLGVPAAEEAARPPAVKDAAWPRTDIDRFLLAGAGSEGPEARSPTPTGAR